MADFSTKSTDTNTVIEPSAVIVTPVDRSNELAGFENIGRGIAQGAGVLGSFMKSRKEADSGKVLANFSIQLNDLQDAFDQGSISSSEYGMRRRALLKQKLADAPALEEDFLKRYSTFREQNGLSAVDGPGVQQAKIRQDSVTAAVNNGFLPISKVGDTQAEDIALQNYERFNTSTRQLKEESDRISLESSKLELGSKKRSEKEAEGKAVVLTGLAKIGRDATPYWRTQYENIKTRAAQATNEMERRQIISDGIMKMDQDYAQRAAAISGDTLNVDQGRIDQVLKPQADLIAAYKKELNGEYDTDTFNRYVDAAQARAKALAMDGLDDQTKQWIAVSEIAKSAPGAFNQQILTGVTAAFGKNAGVVINEDGTVSSKPADLLPTGEAETKDVKNYLGSLTNVIEDSMKDRFKTKTPEEKAALDAEIKTQMNAIFKGVDVHSNSVQSAKEFQPVIDFFSNPVVGEYLRGEGVDPSLRADVAKVMQNGYAAQVVPMLRDSYDQMIEKKPGTLGASSSVDAGNLTPSLESGKFAFKWTGSTEPTFGEKARLREMNSSPFVKVLNKMMIADANIRGDGDVQKSWEETYKPAIFPDEQGDTSAEGAATPISATAYVDPMVATPNAEPQDFVIEDLVKMDNFSVPEEAGTLTEGLKNAASGKFTGPVEGFINESDPIKIASSFVGMNENDDADVIASFIKKAVGTNINPASTAWCAAFVNAVLGASGSQGTGKLNARSFLGWGKEVDTPTQGDVVVFARGNSNWKGHVGFFKGFEEKDGEQYVKVLGGNQSDSVKESLYPASKVLGFRRAV